MNRRNIILTLAVAGVVGFAVWATPDPSSLPRDPHVAPTYRAYVNHGLYAVRDGKYDDALKSLLYVHENCPHFNGYKADNRIWLIATIHLAVCCEELGLHDQAEGYYAQAGRFSNMANNIRSGNAWRRMRRQMLNAQNKEIP